MKSNEEFPKYSFSDFAKLRENASLAKSIFYNDLINFLKFSIDEYCKNESKQSEILDSIGFAIDNHFDLIEKIQIQTKIEDLLKGVFILKIIQYKETGKKFASEILSTLLYIEKKGKKILLNQEVSKLKMDTNFSETSKIIYNISHSVDSKAFDLKNTLVDTFFFKQSINPLNTMDILQNELKICETKLLNFQLNYSDILKELTITHEEIDNYTEVEDLLFKLNYKLLFNLNKNEILFQVENDLTEIIAWFNYSQFINFQIIKDQSYILHSDEKQIENKNGKSFNSNLNENQIKSLFEKLLKNKYIDESTNFDHFKEIFKNMQLPLGFKKVKWINENLRKKSNQTSLRAFLKATMIFETKEPDQLTIDSCFTDRHGEKIVLSKFKKSASTERWDKKFKAMIT